QAGRLLLPQIRFRDAAGADSGARGTGPAAVRPAPRATTRPLPAGQQADSPVTGDSAASVGVEPVAAGDPQARAGEHHVVRVRPGHAVERRPAGGDHAAGACVETLQPVIGYRAGAGLVAAVRV